MQHVPKRVRYKHKNVSSSGICCYPCLHVASFSDRGRRFCCVSYIMLSSFCRKNVTVAHQCFRCWWDFCMWVKGQVGLWLPCVGCKYANNLVVFSDLFNLRPQKCEFLSYLISGSKWTKCPNNEKL